MLTVFVFVMNVFSLPGVILIFCSEFYFAVTVVGHRRFTFKFNTVKFAILDLRKHKHMTNKNMQLVKRLNISVLKDLICLSGNDYLQIGVLLKYSNHSRTEFARVWPARK